MATKLQERAVAIKRENPGYSISYCMVMAGYSKKTATHPKADFLESKGVMNLQELLRFELVSKGITPKLIAKQTKEGIKSEDLKTRLPYLIEAKKDLGMSEETPDTAIQINLGKDLEALAE